MEKSIKYIPVRIEFDALAYANNIKAAKEEKAQKLTDYRNEQINQCAPILAELAYHITELNNNFTFREATGWSQVRILGLNDGNLIVSDVADRFLNEFYFNKPQAIGKALVWQYDFTKIGKVEFFFKDGELSRIHIKQTEEKFCSLVEFIKNITNRIV